MSWLARALARLSAALLALVFHDVGCHVLEDGGLAGEFEKSIYESWRRSHYFGFTGSPPRNYIVFPLSGRPFLVTPLQEKRFSWAELRSSTPWGLLSEIRKVRLAAEVMES